MPIVTGPGDMQGVQVPDTVGNYARIMQLRNEMQNAPLQRQALQQQVQAGALENQQRQQQMQDAQTLRTLSPDFVKKDAGGKITGYDYQGFFNKAATSGVSPNTLLPLQKSISEATMQQANASKAQRENQEAINSQAYQHLEGLKGVSDPAQRQQLWTAATQWAQQNAPTAAQALPQQAPDDKGLAIIEAQLGMHAQQLQDASKLIENTKAVAQTGEASARANEATVNASMAPAKLASQQANEAVTRQQGQQRISIEEARLAFDQKKASIDQAQSGLTGSDFLGTLPAGVQSQVKAMANGDIAIPPAGTRNPQAQQLRTAVMTYDPTYTDARYKGKQNFKTSGDAQNVVQLSTAMEHADRAIANSAKAGYAPALGSKTFESGESAAYMQDAEFLTGEVGKLVKNGVLSVDEGNKISSGLTSARQGVRDSALNETMDLLGGKARAMFQKYKTSTGQDLPTNEFFDGKTQQRLTKYGITEGGASGGAASGSGGAPQGGNVAPEGTIVQTANGPMIKRSGAWVKP